MTVALTEARAALRKDMAGDELPGMDSLLTRPMGLYGWDALEPVLLAAVVSETPLLLVGPHGSAKSYFLERLAKALGLEYRFYNASLINYDDLVGIPMPDEDRKRLHYIATAASIWDAEVVFLDEINRTKPELQNKIFPIIHERRVQGVDLDKLRFRWAAMNPPATGDFEEAAYLGTMPLDTALADRFGFIVQVPSWNNLTSEEKNAVLDDTFSTEPVFTTPISEVIACCREQFESLMHRDNRRLKEYLVLLADELVRSDIRLSTRRMTMLYANILAVQAALQTLAMPDAVMSDQHWKPAAWLALQHSLPQTAGGDVPDRFKLGAAHLQAYALATSRELSEDQKLLSISSPTERFTTAIRRFNLLSPETVTAAVTEFLANDSDPVERGIRTLALYTATHHHLDFPVAVLDAMTDPLEEMLALDPGVTGIGHGHTSYLETLDAPISGECTPEEYALQHSARALEKWVYLKTGSTGDCKKARNRFRKHVRRIAGIITTSGKDTCHAS